eukprot:8226331-Alexandrium_andersonii.AAC.1
MKFPWQPPYVSRPVCPPSSCIPQHGDLKAHRGWPNRCVQHRRGQALEASWVRWPTGRTCGGGGGVLVCLDIVAYPRICSP